MFFFIQWKKWQLSSELCFWGFFLSVAHLTYIYLPPCNPNQIYRLRLRLRLALSLSLSLSHKELPSTNRKKLVYLQKHVTSQGNDGEAVSHGRWYQVWNVYRGQGACRWVFMCIQRYNLDCVHGIMARLSLWTCSPSLSPQTQHDMVPGKVFSICGWRKHKDSSRMAVWAGQSEDLGRHGWPGQIWILAPDLAANSVLQNPSADTTLLGTSCHPAGTSEVIWNCCKLL